MKCVRCGDTVPRLTLEQRYCGPCGREVAAIVKADQERRNRFRFGKLVSA